MAHIISVRGRKPEIGKDCFLAVNATLVGDVKLGDSCSIWFNAVVRGDVNSITIGNHTNIQDGVVVHCSYEKAKTIIGSDVSIGHNAIVHGCTVEDEVLIGMGAIVMDHAVVRKGCIIAAGAVVRENMVCEAGYVYAGAPARKIKKVTESLRQMVADAAGNYPMYAGWYKETGDNGQ
jgi:carbonic anhydrase/acetyltransferase-like protein (isoleucine patch superfamily)